MRITEALAQAGIPSFEAEVLLAHLLQKERTWLLAHGDDPLSESDRAAYQSFLVRRREHEPVAYITGEQEFYGRPFIVNEHVLIPRPSTEGLIEATLGLLNNGTEGRHEVDTGISITTQTLRSLDEAHTIVDIGTGSGCIAVTLACELPNMSIVATDISSEALAVAKANAERQGVTDRMTFLQGDGPEILTITEPYVLVSNPPYIPAGTALQPDVEHYEPHRALFGGKGGTDLLRRIATWCTSDENCRAIVLEHRSDQVW